MISVGVALRKMIEKLLNARRKAKAPRVKLTVNQSRCLGCFLCVKVAPDAFFMNQDGKAQAVSESPLEANIAVEAAIHGCPACAIRKALSTHSTDRDAR